MWPSCRCGLQSAGWHGLLQVHPLQAEGVSADEAIASIPEVLPSPARAPRDIHRWYGLLPPLQRGSSFPPEASVIPECPPVCRNFVGTPALRLPEVLWAGVQLQGSGHLGSRWRIDLREGWPFPREEAARPARQLGTKSATVPGVPSGSGHGLGWGLLSHARPAESLPSWVSLYLPPLRVSFATGGVDALPLADRPSASGHHGPVQANVRAAGSPSGNEAEGLPGRDPGGNDHRPEEGCEADKFSSDE
mmetsp:Transcript_61240/g.145935  ORF Transcript_61240/g.145935 Transcript_61240/m.145935 type:complete len:248 (+) Transcript_61240:496-1239(+)